MRREREMSRRFWALIFSVIMCGSILMVGAASTPISKNYGDVTLSGGAQSGNFADVWDLTSCDMVIQFTYNANGLVDSANAHAWSALGVRQIGYPNFNPTWDVEGAGVWLATDYDWNAGTLGPDPAAPTLDLDDKLILQKAGGHGEGDYNLPSAPPNPWANYAIWFDRDGVDPWQDDDPATPPPGGSAVPWGSHNGQTYNTGGTYDVTITLHANSATSGTAFMTVNGLDQGFYVPDYHAGAPDLYPAGMTFTGDMARMQVYYGLYGYGATHTIAFEDIRVTGCMRTVTIDGCDSGVQDRIYNDKLISEYIAQCAADAGNHGRFVNCVVKLTRDLVRAGIITGREKGVIDACAGRATNIP